MALVKRKIVDVSGSLPRHPTRKWGRRWRKIQEIYVHSLGTRVWSPWEIAAYHIKPGSGNHISKRGCPGICYHEVIAPHGTAYICNKASDITWHTKGQNTSSYGICLMYAGASLDPPNPEMMGALVWRCANLCLSFGLSPRDVKGHREAKSAHWFDNGSIVYRKTCPGLGVVLSELRLSVCIEMQRYLFRRGLYKGKVDGIWGKLSTRASKELRKQVANG